MYDKAIEALENHNIVMLDRDTLEQLESYGIELQEDIDEAQQTLDQIDALLNKCGQK